MSWYGHHHTEESKKRISEALRNRPQELKDKIGATHGGKHRPAETKAKISAALKGRRTSYGMLGKHHSDETRIKISIAVKKNPMLIEQCRAAQKARLNYHHSEATKAKLRSHWQNPQWVALHNRAQNIKPNKAELQLQAILDRYSPGEWKFVGNGQLIIGGKIPDFVNVNGKKQLIELFGAHWHNIFDVAERKEHFRQYGFQTAIVWEDELKNEKRLAKTLKKRF